MAAERRKGSGAAALAWGTHRYASNVNMGHLLARTADNLGNRAATNSTASDSWTRAGRVLADLPTAGPGIP
jgi:hypothetical protein